MQTQNDVLANNAVIHSLQPIQRFKDLYIDCSEKDARNFFSRLTKFLSNECQADRWSNDIESMRRLQDSICFRTGLFSSSILCDNQARPLVAATLSYDDDAQRIWLCNIVPCQANELSCAEYNLFLDQFYEDVVKVVKEPLKCQITSGTFTGPDVMTHESWELLCSFSDCANRTSLHPDDNKAWHRFVISVFLNDKGLDSSTLGKLLKEELGWNADKALELMIRFEDEIDLLNEYANG